MREHAAEVAVDEARGDPVAEAAGEDRRAAMLEVGKALEAALRDQVCRSALVGAHAREHLGHQQADVVIDAQLRADVAGAGHPAVVPGEHERYERGVEVDDRRQRVERTLGQRALGARAGRRRRFAGHRADELHEELGQFHVVQRVEHAQRTHARLRAGCCAARRPPRAPAPRRSRPPAAGGRGAAPARAAAVSRGRARSGTQLQVARVLRRLAVDHPRMRRGHEVRW